MAEPTFVGIIADDLQIGGVCHHLKGRELELEVFLDRFSHVLFGCKQHYLYQVDIDYLANRGIIISDDRVSLASDFLRSARFMINSLGTKLSKMEETIKELQGVQAPEDEESSRENESEESVEEKEEEEAPVTSIIQPTGKTISFKRLEKQAGRPVSTVIKGRKRGPMSESQKDHMRKAKLANKVAKEAKLALALAATIERPATPDFNF